MADYRVNLRSSPKLIESAAASQLANRVKLEIKELRRNIKEKIKPEASRVLSEKQRTNSNGLSTEILKAYNTQVDEIRKLKDDSFKIWTRRKRRGGGFLLVPDKAPKDGFIELIVGNGFENSAFGVLRNNVADDPGYEYQSDLLTASVQYSNPNDMPLGTIKGGDGSRSLGSFYHIANSNLPAKKPYPFTNDTPYNLEIYELCTFEIIVKLGSAPMPNDGPSITYQPLKEGYVYRPPLNLDLSPLPAPPPPGFYLGITSPGTMATFHDTFTEIVPPVYIAETSINLGGYSFFLNYDSFVNPGIWKFTMPGISSNLQVNDDQLHIAVVYGNTSAKVFVNGSLFYEDQMTDESKANLNFATAETSISSYAYVLNTVQVQPKIDYPGWGNPQGARGPVSVYHSVEEPVYNENGELDRFDYVLNYIGDLIYDSIKVQSPTTECQCGIKGLRFTPEQALYTENFTPPTRITELA